MTIMFSPGAIVATPGALAAISAAGQEPGECLSRHLHGDWGELDYENRAVNEMALIDGRLLSA